MKNCRWFVLPVLVFLAACEYKAPLKTEHVIPVDSAVLGYWKHVPKADEPSADTRMKVLRFSATEYLIHYFEDDGELYVRAYLARISDSQVVQLELIGDDDGPVSNEDVDLYNVATYKLENDELEVRMLNTDLVDDELADSESLLRAFLEHKDDPELFGEAGIFKRVTNQPGD